MLGVTGLNRNKLVFARGNRVELKASQKVNSTGGVVGASEYINCSITWILLICLQTSSRSIT